MRLLLICLLLFGLAWANLTCECGKRNAGRIAGGKATHKNEYPWMVALQITKNNASFCGGTIVTQRHVLSAAHCVWSRKPKDVAVVVGAHDLTNWSDNAKQYHLVEQIIMHPSYNNKTDYDDISILLIYNKIQYNRFISPVCMPSEVLGDEMTGQIVKAMGWGDIDGEVAKGNQLKQLREVDLKLIYHKYCKKPGTAVLCTLTEGKDTCKGDSGGPLVWLDPEINRFTLVGIVSFGYTEKCGNTKYPGINTNVSAYLNWIDDIISPLTFKETRTCHKI